MKIETEAENNSNIKYIVYCTTNLVNGKIYIGVHKTKSSEYFDGYIGCGVYINKPSTYNHPKYPFQYAVKKYGPKNFRRVTIKEYPDTEQGEEEAFNLEAEIVDEQFLSRPDVYNIALGGKFGSNLQKIPCYQYDSDGNFIKEYKSYSDASKELNRNLRSIQRSIKNKTKCAGYFLTDKYFTKLDITKMYNYTGYNCIPVYQYSSTGEYECCYESIRDAARVLKINDSNIGNAIKLERMCNNKYFSNFFSPEYRQAKTTKITSSIVHQYDLEGNYIASYKNMQEAKNILNIKSNIYNAIKLQQLCGGYQWSFEKLDKMPPIKPKSGRARKVGKYDKDWNLIKEYNTLQECKKENGSGMIHVLNGRDQFAKGFRYKYLN